MNKLILAVGLALLSVAGTLRADVIAEVNTWISSIGKQLQPGYTLVEVKDLSSIDKGNIVKFNYKGEDKFGIIYAVDVATVTVALPLSEGAIIFISVDKSDIKEACKAVKGETAFLLPRKTFAYSSNWFPRRFSAPGPFHPLNAEG